MAIRIRQAEGITVAICAAMSEEKEGDIYLDDNAHHALSTKFNLDWISEGLMNDDLSDKRLHDFIRLEQGGLMFHSDHNSMMERIKIDPEYRNKLFKEAVERGVS